jgi:probable HAF family extracellular repeat protein
MQLRLKSVSASLALSAFALAAHAQTTYQLTPLGSLGGGTAVATAINSAGDVVGCSAAIINGEPTGRAFVYRNGLMMDIGSLADGGTSCASDINDAGQITGVSATPSGEQRGFIYTNGTMTSLGNAGTSSIGNAINNTGLVAGTANGLNGKPLGAFRYDARLAQPQVDIGDLGSGIITSKSINAAGTIVGFASNANFRGTTFVYQNGQLTDLGDAVGFPNSVIGVGVINDLGHIVGSRNEGGFLYVNGAVTTLPPLAAGGRSVPASINNSGQIVGYASTDTGTHAVVITQGQIADLNDAIVANSPDKPFVTLEGAADINGSGWIVANGRDTRTGLQGAYLLRPVTAGASTTTAPTSTPTPSTSTKPSTTTKPSTNPNKGTGARPRTRR